MYRTSLKSIYNIIGLDKLGISNLNGGKQKQLALKKLLQYIDIQKVEGNKRAIQVVDIYEKPHIIDNERGKKGFYIDRSIPIMLDYLLQVDRLELLTNINMLSKVIGIVNFRFKVISNDELLQINNRFTHNMVNDFYFRCKTQQEQIIFRLLDRLQNEYSVITYYKKFNIIDETGEEHVSSVSDEYVIEKAQKEVLDEFNSKNILIVYKRKREKKFFDRVCQIINEKYNLNWEHYYRQIQIFIHEEKLKEAIAKIYINKALFNDYKFSMSDRFAKSIKSKTLKAIQNRKSDEINSYQFCDDYHAIQEELISFFTERI